MLSEPWSRASVIARTGGRSWYNRPWTLHPRADDWFAEKLKAYDVEGADSEYLQSLGVIHGAVLVEWFETLKRSGQWF